MLRRSSSKWTKLYDIISAVYGFEIATAVESVLWWVVGVRFDLNGCGSRQGFYVLGVTIGRDTCTASIFAAKHAFLATAGSLLQ